MAHGETPRAPSAKPTPPARACAAGVRRADWTDNARINPPPRPCRLMTFQKMTDDLIDYRKGILTMDQLRERYPTWKVKPEDAKFCVNAAMNAGKPRA